ncbi:MAG TPA: DUF2318 domain-containing protein [Bacillota bacterium]|nr:DUF2318 domain-containing protein [Bacillota bacterium]
MIIRQPASDGQAMPAGETEKEATVNDNGDLVIAISDITENATFYAYNELDSKMGIIAVKASDGTIRTAFNTCQVCYDSGKGYYKQDGDFLTCQNCGNQFGRDDVEVAEGGCNPVPITDEYKRVTGDTITISKEFLEEAQAIFENWKI